MNRAVVDAYMEAGDGWSTDRVIADPELNARFIEGCRHRGLKDASVDLNLTLINTRKRGLLPRGARRTSVRNQDAYIFASEIAIRSLERKHQTTLDRVLCDPILAHEFDAVAAAIAPGFTAMEYRWAALRLRKSSKLKPEILGRVVRSTVFGPVAVPDLDLSAVPAQQGLYVLTSHKKVLYVGETQNLRARVRKHLDHSDNKLLARYIWKCGYGKLVIEYHVLPQNTRTDVRKAMELELIRSRGAEFNVRR